MPDERPWTTDQILSAVEDALRPLVAEIKGKVDVASDIEHAYELLENGPVTWRLIIGWPGYGEHQTPGMGKHRMFAIVQVAKGLEVKPGDILHRNTGRFTGPMGHLIDKVSAWIRAFRFPNGSNVVPNGFDQAGSAWLMLEGVETKQHQIDFTLDAALPHEETTIPLILTSPATT